MGKNNKNKTNQEKQTFFFKTYIKFQRNRKKKNIEFCSQQQNINNNKKMQINFKVFYLIRLELLLCSLVWYGGDFAVFCNQQNEPHLVELAYDSTNSDEQQDGGGEDDAVINIRSTEQYATVETTTVGSSSSVDKSLLSISRHIENKGFHRWINKTLKSWTGFQTVFQFNLYN